MGRSALCPHGLGLGPPGGRGALGPGVPDSLVPVPWHTSVTLEENFTSLSLSFHMCKMGLQYPLLREHPVGVQTL